QVSKMASGVTQFQESNHRIFTFFRVFGVFQVRHNGTKHYVNPLSYTFARFMWLSWYVIGTSAGVWIKLQKSNDISAIKHHPLLDAALLVVVFMLVGPVQLHILLRNHQWLPKILNDIYKLENLPLGPGANQNYRSPNIHIQNSQDDSTEDNNSSNAEAEISKCNRILPKITVGILVAVFLICFGIALFSEITWADLRDEYKLVMIIFYLVFPVFTTWLCIVLIKHHTLMYRVIQEMDEKEFENKKTIRLIEDYMSQMHHIFEKMNNHIFQFTLGINFAIFVLSGAISMFELLQGWNDKAYDPKKKFTDVIYIIPLGICIGHIFAVCRASDDLNHNVKTPTCKIS
ncbi:unnamed protein product, partial [Meganyctiphanes norvegica]